MEKRSFSPEHEDEVVDLLDIVPSGIAPDEEGEDIIELTREDIQAGESDMEDILDLTDVVEAANTKLSDAADGSLLSLGAVPAGSAPAEREEAGLPELFEAPASEEPDIMEEEPVPAPACVEEEVFLRFAAEFEERLNALELRRTAELQSFEQRLAEEADRHAAEMQAFQASFTQLEQSYASTAQELQDAFSASEEELSAKVQALEERLAASEEARTVLAARVEELEQQLVKCSSLFLEDPTLRLALEEMVSRMLEARMPVALQSEAGVGSAEDVAVAEEGQVRSEEASACPDGADVEEASPEVRPAAEGSVPSEEEEARRAIVETIDELSLHLSELEERVAAWEARCEQEAALAAARVIREEIAVIKSGASRMAH